jgi:hypothetical protein
VGGSSGSGGAGGAGTGGAGGGASGKHLLVLIDMSGSMLETGTGQATTKWQLVSTAVDAWVAEPQSAGLSLAVEFFPISGNTACDGSGYDVPTVPMGTLSGSGPAIVNAVASQTPFGTSSLEPELRGAMTYCMNRHNAMPNLDCNVVLVTDGAPNTCATDTSTLSGIVMTAASSYGVHTWVIGLYGADMTQMNSIAEVGGTNCNSAGGLPWACDATGSTPTLLSFLEYVRDHL